MNGRRSGNITNVTNCRSRYTVKFRLTPPSGTELVSNSQVDLTMLGIEYLLHYISIFLAFNTYIANK